MTTMPIRDVSLFVKVMGQGYPLVLMHGGPGLDHTTLLALQPLADQFTLIFYDHRCNGRSEGAEVSSMTFENLTADADALRQTLGFDKWAVLGHSFGGNVALEYALRYPQSLSHLILMDTGGDQWWVNQNAPEILAKRGYSAGAVQAARRFYNGQMTPGEFLPTFMKFMSAYFYRNLAFWGWPTKCFLGTPSEDATRSPHLWLQPAAQGLDGDGPAQRDQGAYPGFGRALRLSVSAGTSGDPCGWNTERTPGDYRACRS